MPQPVAVLSPLPAAALVSRAPAGLSEHQRSFAAALGRADTRQLPAPDRARDAAEQFVAQTLILPLLKQLRATNQAAPPFAPTQAERQFGALQDAESALQIAHATRFPLVDRLARDLLTKAGLDASGPASALIPGPVTPPALNLGADRLARPR